MCSKYTYNYQNEEINIVSIIQFCYIKIHTALNLSLVIFLKSQIKV